MMERYFNNVDLSKGTESSLNTKIEEAVDSVYNTVRGSIVKFFDKELYKKDDYLDLIHDIIDDAFDTDEQRKTCKAIFAIYLSGLSLKDSNMFGLIMLLLVAVRYCGSIYDKTVYKTYRKYLDELSNHSLEPITVGNITKCNYLGNKIDFDMNDTFANVTDNKYAMRLLANVRDYDKHNNKGYSVRSNTHQKFGFKFKSVINAYKNTDMFKDKVKNLMEYKKSKGTPITQEEAEKAVLNNPIIRKTLMKNNGIDYDTWKSSRFQDMLKGYEQDQSIKQTRRHGSEEFN